MKLLLDTCTLLWWLSEDEKVPRPLLRELEAVENEIFLSVASAWEIAVKSKIGKLVLPSPPLAFVEEAIDLYRLTVLPIELAEAVRSGELPLHHKDPFDRMLIAQAQVRSIAIATPERAFQPYDVETRWPEKGRRRR